MYQLLKIGSMKKLSGQQSVTLTFFCFLISDFKAFGSKKSCLREQDKALKDTFFLFHFKVQSLPVFKNSY